MMKLFKKAFVVVSVLGAALFSLSVLAGEDDSQILTKDLKIVGEKWTVKVGAEPKSRLEKVDIFAKDESKVVLTYTVASRAEHFNIAQEVTLDGYETTWLAVLWDNGLRGQVLDIFDPASPSKKAIYELNSSGPITFYPEDDHVAINYYSMKAPKADSMDMTWKPKGVAKSKTVKSEPKADPSDSPSAQ